MQHQPFPAFKEPPFSVFEALINGLRGVWLHRRMFMILSIMPVLLTFVTLLVARGVGLEGVFFAPVIQFPASVMLGIQCAVILRFLVLGEFPVIMDGAARRTRNEMIMHAGLVYAAVQFFIAGIFAGLLTLNPYMQANPDVMAPYMPFMVLVLVLMIWAMRWLWLYVPVALGWQSQGFFNKIGRWGGSLRVFGVYVLCSAVVNMVVSVLILIIRGAGAGGASGQEGVAKIGGVMGVFLDALVAVGTVAAGVVFAAATAAAVKAMLQSARVKVDA